MKKILLIAVFTATILFVSCDKDAIVENSSSKTTIKNDDQTTAKVGDTVQIVTTGGQGGQLPNPKP